MSYYLEKQFTISYEKAIERITSALAEQGFGILTEIDVKATLKKKLDVDFRRYVILGACNPSFAYTALQAEKNIGVMLPCNVIVQEISPGQSEIAIMDPAGAMSSVNNPDLVEVAEGVRIKLQTALNNV